MLERGNVGEAFEAHLEHLTVSEDGESRLPEPANQTWLALQMGLCPDAWKARPKRGQKVGFLHLQTHSLPTPYL